VPTRRTVWLTYAWADNRTGDINFIVQELQKVGLAVKLDRWNIAAGRRLWDQIDSFISDPAQSDAWLLVATPASLASEACKEEFAYALDRALRARGGDYPVIALFPGTVDASLIPAGIRTRLYISLTDPDWKERVASSTERREARISTPALMAFDLQIHRNVPGGREFAIEVRPRAGSWQPFFAATPLAEKDVVRPSMLPGPKGRPPEVGMLTMTDAGPSTDDNWWVIYAGNEATPTTSYFIFCDSLPTRLVFGVYEGQPQYVHDFSAQ
jgi:hypothetical protein